MTAKNSIQQVTFEDIARSSEINEKMIRDIFSNLKIFGDSDKMMSEISGKYIKRIVEEMKVAIPSLSAIRNSQPTRFLWLLAQEMLRASEKVKREDAPHLNGYDVELDITNTREALERQLASHYKMEVVIWKLIETGQYEQALTIVEAIEIQRGEEDSSLWIEVLNWKMEILSKLGHEEAFFETLQKALDIVSKEGVKCIKYDGPAIKNSLGYLLMKKFPKGIPIAFNQLGMMKMSSAINFPMKVGMEFQSLLEDKIIEGIFKNREITTSHDLDKFLSREWVNIVSSFRLINRFVSQVAKPYGLH